jgi:hypothetical protein
MKKLWGTLFVFGLILCTSGLVFANTIPMGFVQIDGDRFPLIIEEFQDTALGKILFRIPEQTFIIDGGMVVVGESFSDPDPTLMSVMTATDFGPPSMFHLFASIPIVLPAGPTIVSGSIAGGLIDGSFGVDGATLTPVAPLMLPVDTDGITETLVSAASTISFVNLGVDTGLTGTVSPPIFVATYGSFMAGPQSGPAGPFTTLAHEYSFMLSGGSDTASLVAGTQLIPDLTAIPEPGSLSLLGSGVLGLLGYGWWRRKWASR